MEMARRLGAAFRENRLPHAMKMLTQPRLLIAAAGGASVTVLDPGGAVSNALTFTITGASTPTLTTLSPSSAVAGGRADMGETDDEADVFVSKGAPEFPATPLLCPSNKAQNSLPELPLSY